MVYNPHEENIYWSFMYLAYLLMAGTTFLLFGLLQFLAVRDDVYHWLPYLLIIVSFPHFMLTYWIWKERVNDWKRELWPLLFPIFYFVLFVVSLKFNFSESIIRLSYVYLLYHFAQQLFGITMWMNVIHKIHLVKYERVLWRTFYLLSAFYALIELELRGGTSVLFYHPVKLLNLPGPLYQSIFILIGLIFLNLVLIRLYRFVSNKNAHELDPLLVSVVALLWFIPPFSYDLVLFLPVLHGLQYLPFLFMKKRSKGFLSFALSFGVGILIGWITFRWLPFHSPNWMSGNMWAPLILTMLNNHHFIIDGRIWKLRDPANEILIKTDR